MPDTVAHLVEAGKEGISCLLGVGDIRTEPNREAAMAPGGLDHEWGGHFHRDSARLLGDCKRPSLGATLTWKNWGQM